MKPTTREQVKVTLLVDLEYELLDGRDYMIHCLNREVDIDMQGASHRGFYAMKSVADSVTISSNDESVIRAWKVKYKNQDPVIIRTTSGLRASVILSINMGLIGDDPLDYTYEPAPSFDWNSQLIPGNVYSLEHAEAGNKKP